jgi:antiviral defense system Shedu protein SduA
MNSCDEQDWLEQFHARRPVPISGLAERFEDVINTAEREEDLQKFLAENPFILAEQLPHCHYVIPKFRFGGRYVSDFLLPEIASSGRTLVLVELEPVNAQLVTQSGHLAERVRAGIQQVKDWRDWLMDNRDEAIRPRARNGLGLTEIEDIWGWVVVGRRNQVTERFNQLRNQVLRESRIEIKTYDRLLEWFKVRAAHWEEWERSMPALVQNFAAGI